ncbi:MAG: cation:proton antiporter [Candidatus Competibacterales bacterium]
MTHHELWGPIGAGLLAIGVGFFIAGTVALLRFPDLYTKLHGLTKADNTGLGFIALGVALLSGSPLLAVELLVLWLLVLIGGAVGCMLLARHARRRGLAAWRPPQ